MQRRTGAGWIEIVRFRAEFPSWALPLLVECETRRGRDRIRARTLGAERGERRLHGWELTANRIKLSTLIIESNYSHDVRCRRLHPLTTGSTSSSQSVYFAGKVLTLMDQSPQSPHITTWWWWQVLLVSPPPQTDNDSLRLTDTGSDMVYTKPFAPWKPGDAYSVETDLSDWRLLLGSVQDGSQSRWDRKEVCAVNLQGYPIEIYPENSESVRMFPRMCRFRQNASR